MLRAENWDEDTVFSSQEELLTFFPKEEMAQPANVPAAPAAELTRSAGEEVFTFTSGIDASFATLSGYVLTLIVRNPGEDTNSPLLLHDLPAS